MNSGRAALLTVALATGCLDPMANDAPGFSTHVLAANAEVPDATSDMSLSRRIDANDGVATAVAPLKSAFVGGEPVSYWDLGVAKSSLVPAYQLVECDADGVPAENGDIGHPLIVDSAPGDSDYTQLWAVMPVCITRYYNGQHIPSATALDDAIELELVREPQKATRFAFYPIVPASVSLANFDGGRGAAYYKGFALGYLDFGSAGNLTVVDGKFNTPNVYEIMVAGAKSPALYVFAVGPNSPKYAPIWTQYTVVVSDTLDLTTVHSEADLVTIADDKSMKPASSSIIAVFASGTKAARPMKGAGVQP